MVRDGQGKVECCYSNGCNSDLTTATRSLQYLDRPMNSVEINLIQQKAENIQRLRELEEARTKQILGRTGLALTEEQCSPLSLVERIIVLLRQLSYAILFACSSLVLYGIRDSWLPCT